MSVKLISYTQPVEHIDMEDAQELIAYCARVSNPANQHNTETSDKLVKYLIKHKHWSPLEMVSATIEINAPRDIARQILRHRSFSFQEFSQRYADPTKDLTFITREPRLQDDKNRQNSIELDMTDADNRELADIWHEKQTDLIRQARLTYEWAVNNGIAKEQARAVLPEGLTMSRMYMAGTLRSWVHYIELRTGPETQKEHREIAKECALAIADIFPMIGDILSD